MTDNPNQADDFDTGSEADGVAERERAAEKEFDKAQTQKTQTLSEADKYVLEERDRKQAEKLTNKLSDAVKTLQSKDTLKTVHPDILEGALHRKAAADEIFKQHFYDQDKNPSAWKGDLDNLASDLSEKMKPNDKATEDLAAANASIRGESTETPRPKSDAKPNSDVDSMSDVEFNNYIYGGVS